MCGILGYCGQPDEGRWGQTHALLEALFLASEHRGRHATGFVARTHPFKGRGKGNIVLDKAPLPAAEFLRHSGPWRGLRGRRCSSVVGHVRWATHGSPRDNANNHPFVGRRGLYLVHNGVLLDHAGVCERRGLSLNSACDSEAILRLVEASRVPALGLAEAVGGFRGFRGFRGSMAVAVYDGQSDVTYLARNEGRPLWLARLRGDRRWFYASTRDILTSAFRSVLGRRAPQGLDLLLPLAAGQVHVLTSDGTLRGLPATSDGVI